MQDYILRIRRGDTFQLQVNYENPDTTPINMTGWTLLWYTTANDIVFTKTQASPGVTFTPATGSMLLVLSSTETQSIPSGTAGNWFLRVTDPSAVVTTLAAGSVEVK